MQSLFLYTLTLIALGAVVPRTANADPWTSVVNGLGELGEPTTVGLVQGTVPEDGFLVCSGVLIGCDTVITTAHCFNTNTALKTWLYVPHAGFAAVESATRHPAYVEALTEQPPGWIDTTRVEDISFVKLAEPIVGVTPSTIPLGGTLLVGEPGFVVGFGRDPVSEAGVQNPGLKRSGAMQRAACEGSLAGLDLLCWNPTDPLPPPGEEVSNCSGDSGGPLFGYGNGGRFAFGITKGAVYDPQGQPDPCLPPVQPYDVSVNRHSNWIGGGDGSGGMVAATSAVPLRTKQCSPVGQLAEDAAPSPSCDGSAWGPSERARTCGFEGVLGGFEPVEAQYSFDVPAGTATLRVALNGIAASAGGIDTDLYLREGQPAKKNVNDCAADGTGTLGFCEIDAPAPGSWYVLVDQALGEGDHQVVVTFLAGASVPGLGWTARLVLLLAVLAAAGAARARY